MFHETEQLSQALYILLQGYVLSVVNLTKVSSRTLTPLESSAIFNKKLACDKELFKKINDKIFVIKVNSLETLWLCCTRCGSTFCSEFTPCMLLLCA